METTILNQNKSFISKEINNEGKKYICRIELIEELIQINLFLDNKLKYKGYIFLEKNSKSNKSFL